MNPEELGKFESKLRKVRPAAPPPGIEATIARRLKAAKSSKRLRVVRSGMSWAGLAVAASVLIAFGILLFDGRLLTGGGSRPEAGESVADGTGVGNSTPLADSFKPVLAENNLKNRVDEGIVFLRNGLTARRYRYEFIDRIVWKNPSDGAVVEMEIPRDEVVLVPVQTY